MNTVFSDLSSDITIDNTQFVVRNYPTLDSTNAFLKTHHSIFPDFCVISTTHQTAGKGRFDRTWIAPPGKSLTFSVKLPLHDIPAQNWCNITQLMALSVAYVLEDLGLNPRLKWPNDVIIRDAKICGILAELIQTGTTHTMILGTGLNILECKDDFLSLDNKATSVFLETGTTYTVADILQKVLCTFHAVLQKLRTQGYESFIDHLSSRLFTSSSPVNVVCGDTEYTGIIVGLTSDGRIQLDTGAGIVTVVSGEITSRI